jgi:hypothetical protein
VSLPDLMSLPDLVSLPDRDYPADLVSRVPQMALVGR